MAYLILGLGNPGEKYENTRHNAGKIIVAELEKIWGDPSTSFRAGKSPAKLIQSETMMNHSGRNLIKLVKSKKQASQLIVLHDDLDLGLGSIRISYNRGTGGHRGLDSIVRQVKTREFIRVRLGIAPVTPSGKVKKPRGEQAVLKHILGEFKPAERKMLERLAKKIASAIETILNESLEKAMTLYNQ